MKRISININKTRLIYDFIGLILFVCAWFVETRFDEILLYFAKSQAFDNVPLI